MLLLCKLRLLRQRRGWQSHPQSIILQYHSIRKLLVLPDMLYTLNFLGWRMARTWFSDPLQKNAHSYLKAKLSKPITWETENKQLAMEKNDKTKKNKSDKDNSYKEKKKERQIMKNLNTHGHHSIQQHWPLFRNWETIVFKCSTPLLPPNTHLSTTKHQHQKKSHSRGKFPSFHL